MAGLGSVWFGLALILSMSSFTSSGQEQLVLRLRLFLLPHLYGCMAGAIAVAITKPKRCDLLVCLRKGAIAVATIDGHLAHPCEYFINLYLPAKSLNDCKLFRLYGMQKWRPKLIHAHI